jgi:hypothetical protein
MAIRDRERIDEDVSVHVFSVSAGLLGVCLTVIGILRVVIAVKGITTIADDLLSLDALVFLTACCCAYAALRTPSAPWMSPVERVADVAFIVGLILMASACAVITYAIF